MVDSDRRFRRPKDPNERVFQDFSLEDLKGFKDGLDITPSIFSEEQTWFRHSNYEIKMQGGHLFIRPAQDAKLEFYNPYDYFPHILLDFFEVLTHAKPEELEDEMLRAWLFPFTQPTEGNIDALRPIIEVDIRTISDEEILLINNKPPLDIQVFGIDKTQDCESQLRGLDSKKHRIVVRERRTLGKGDTNYVRSYFPSKQQRKRAKEMLNFYNRYGPLGVFFEELVGTVKEPVVIARKRKYDYQVHLKLTESFRRSIDLFDFDLNPQDSIIAYDKYAKLYFPKLPKPPSLYSSDPSNSAPLNLSHDFMENYAEDVELIFFNDLFQRFIKLIDRVKLIGLRELELEENDNYNEISFIETVGEVFPEVSDLYFSTYQLTLVNRGGELRIGWKANSLLGILVLMFMECITKLHVEDLTVCGFDDCFRLVPGSKHKFCCQKHADRQRSRDR